MGPSTLAATLEGPRHTRLHSRGSTGVPPTSKGAPFPPPSSRGGIRSLRGRERIPRVPVASREEALSTGKARGTPRSCHNSQSPPDVSTITGKPVFPALPHFQAEDRLTPQWHVGQPCGKASWESLVGEPRGKATDPLIHANGSVTLLLQLGRKAHVQAPTRDEDRLPWGDSRSTPRFMSVLERKPQEPAPTPHKVLGPGIDLTGIP